MAPAASRTADRARGLRPKAAATSSRRLTDSARACVGAASRLTGAKNLAKVSAFWLMAPAISCSGVRCVARSTAPIAAPEPKPASASMPPWLTTPRMVGTFAPSRCRAMLVASCSWPPCRASVPVSTAVPRAKAPRPVLAVACTAGLFSRDRMLFSANRSPPVAPASRPSAAPMPIWSALGLMYACAARARSRASSGVMPRDSISCCTASKMLPLTEPAPCAAPMPPAAASAPMVLSRTPGRSIARMFGTDVPMPCAISVNGATPNALPAAARESKTPASSACFRMAPMRCSSRSADALRRPLTTSPAAPRA